MESGLLFGLAPADEALSFDLVQKDKAEVAVMDEVLLPPPEAALRLGLAVRSLYDWLGQSDRGLLVIRGQSVTIQNLQGGPRGQGRIRIAATEVERLKALMHVQPQPLVPRRPPTPRDSYPGITVDLGLPGR